MPMDERLAERVRRFFAQHRHVTERRMFGGLGWMVGGHMAAGAHPDGRLMIRCARDDYEALLTEPGARALRQGGRTMTGFVMVDADAVADDEELERWLARAHAFTSAQPPKPARG
jgi:TfoX/Sxy family transcriptional regulator of competence genes